MILNMDLYHFKADREYKELWRIYAPYVLVQCEYNDMLWRVFNQDLKPVGVQYAPAGYLNRPIIAMQTHDISMQIHNKHALIKGSLLLDGVQYNAYYFWRSEKPSVFRADNCQVLQRYDDFNQLVR